jgi:hypothetical protein
LDDNVYAASQLLDTTLEGAGAVDGALVYVEFAGVGNEWPSDKDIPRQLTR